MKFSEKLRAASQANNSLICVGLDPSLTQTPVERIATFNQAIIEATQDLVCAYKPNLAFYEAWGPAGLEALSQTLAFVPSHIPVIADAKRNDIGNTAEAYARAIFEALGFDAVTVNPYLGHDSLEPFLSYADKGVFVLCRTSNPGAADFQSLVCDGKPLYRVVADRVEAWNKHGNLGLVVGATQPDELKAIREAHPTLPLLIPGVGAQGGSLELAVKYGHTENGLAVINASRQVLYALSGPDFAAAARSAALSLRDEMNRYLAE